MEVNQLPTEAYTMYMYMYIPKVNNKTNSWQLQNKPQACKLGCQEGWAG